MKKFKFQNPYKENGKTTYPETVNKSGIYIIKKNNDILYIGYSGKNLYRTMYRHFQKWNHKTQQVVTYKYNSSYKVRIVLCTPIQAMKLERALILKYKPKDNINKYEQYQIKFDDKKIIDQYENLYITTDSPF